MIHMTYEGVVICYPCCMISTFHVTFCWQLQMWSWCFICSRVSANWKLPSHPALSWRGKYFICVYLPAVKVISSVLFFEDSQSLINLVFVRSPRLMYCHLCDECGQGLRCDPYYRADVWCLGCTVICLMNEIAKGWRDIIMIHRESMFDICAVCSEGLGRSLGSDNCAYTSYSTWYATKTKLQVIIFT